MSVYATKFSFARQKQKSDTNISPKEFTDISLFHLSRS